MPQTFFQRFSWLAVMLGLLGGCQPTGSKPKRLITGDNYLSTIPNPKTLDGSYVSDPDSILRPGTVASLNARLDSLGRSGRAHLDVVLVRSVGGAIPKMVATDLFAKWQVGRPTHDNGLLLLVVLDQRRIEFETGAGLAADLPEVVCYRLKLQYMRPAARAGHYDQAVQQGVAALIRWLGGSEAAQP